MYYTYVLLSEADRRLYIGATHDLRRRIEQHAAGRVGSTAYRRPLKQRLACTLSSTRDNKLERH